MKDSCTDSDEGREIAQALDPWPHSEAGRFHRGICVALLGLAALIVFVALVRNHQPSEVLVLGGVLAFTFAALVRAAEAFRAAPASSRSRLSPITERRRAGTQRAAGKFPPRGP